MYTYLIFQKQEGNFLFFFNEVFYSIYLNNKCKMQPKKYKKCTTLCKPPTPLNKQKPIKKRK